MKGNIYRIRGTGLYMETVLIENGTLYVFKSRDPSDEKGYCKVVWGAREFPYERLVRKYKYMKFMSMCNHAPLITWKEAYEKVEEK